jgi:hypothetical protein
MRKEYFIPYELALELKGLGFDEKCISFYDKYENLYESEGYYSYKENVCSDEVIAPIFAQAFRFFRDKGYSFNIVGYRSILRNLYSIEIWDGKKLWFDLDSIFDSYEDAELELLKKLIEIVKNK